MSAITRFNNYHTVEPNTGCWLWTMCVDKDGYGIFQEKTRTTVKAHRFSWKVHRGDVAKGTFICHKCDTPSCVNPEHLFLGTALENNRDCAVKKRTHNQKKTHCPNGHRYDSANTYIYASGYRDCRECGKKQAKSYRRKNDYEKK